MQRNHDMIAKTLERHSITDEDLKAFEEEERLKEKESEVEAEVEAEVHPETTEESKKIN